MVAEKHACSFVNVLVFVVSGFFLTSIPQETFGRGKPREAKGVSFEVTADTRLWDFGQKDIVFEIDGDRYKGPIFCKLYSSYEFLKKGQRVTLLSEDLKWRGDLSAPTYGHSISCNITEGLPIQLGLETFLDSIQSTLPLRLSTTVEFGDLLKPRTPTAEEKSAAHEWLLNNGFTHLGQVGAVSTFVELGEVDYDFGLGPQDVAITGPNGESLAFHVNGQSGYYVEASNPKLKTAVGLSFESLRFSVVNSKCKNFADSMSFLRMVVKPTNGQSLPLKSYAAERPMWSATCTSPKIKIRVEAEKYKFGQTNNQLKKLYESEGYTAAFDQVSYSPQATSIFRLQGRACIKYENLDVWCAHDYVPGHFSVKFAEAGWFDSWHWWENQGVKFHSPAGFSDPLSKWDMRSYKLALGDDELIDIVDIGRNFMPENSDHVGCMLLKGKHTGKMGVKCWGENQSFFTAIGLPAPVTLSQIPTVKFVDLGLNFEPIKIVSAPDPLGFYGPGSPFCALASNGRVKCFGDNHGVIEIDLHGKRAKDIQFLMFGGYPKYVSGGGEPFGRPIQVLVPSRGWKSICAQFDDFSVECFGDNGFKVPFQIKGKMLMVYNYGGSGERPFFSNEKVGPFVCGVVSTGALSSKIECAGFSAASYIYEVVGNISGVENLQFAPDLDYMFGEPPFPSHFHGTHYFGFCGTKGNDMVCFPDKSSGHAREFRRTLASSLNPLRALSWWKYPAAESLDNYYFIKENGVIFRQSHARPLDSVGIGAGAFLPLILNQSEVF